MVPTFDIRKILSLTSLDPRGVGRKLGSYSIQTIRRWDPITMNEGENGGFRTGARFSGAYAMRIVDSRHCKNNTNGEWTATCYYETVLWLETPNVERME